MARAGRCVMASWPAAAQSVSCHMSQHWRDIAAFLIAPALVALGVGAVLAPLNVFAVAQIAAVVTFGHALVLGVPAYALLRHRGWLKPVAVLTASFLIGSIPVFAVLTTNAAGDMTAGGVILVESGRITAAGHRENAQIAAIGGVIGAAAGVV